MITLTIETHNAEETRALGKRLGELASTGDLITLSGDLGAGKTELAKGVAAGVGIDPSVPVTSPTFTLVNEYRGRLSLFHFDLYRLSAGDATELGFDEYFFGEGVSLVEWPDRLTDEFPEQTLAVTIDIAGETVRTISLAPKGAVWEKKLQLL